MLAVPNFLRPIYEQKKVNKDNSFIIVLHITVLWVLQSMNLFIKIFVESHG